MSRTLSTALRALGIGAATGLRTLSGPSAVFRGARWGGILPLLGLGELIVDKLPATPVRTRPAGLLARAVGAACAAGALASRNGLSFSAGAAIGIGGALAAAYAGAAYRAAAAETGVPDHVAAALEDLAAYALALAMAGRAAR